MQISRGLHLTYCTNIHAADGWDAVFANLKKYAPALKARLSPSAPFGVGLRLSAREAAALLEGNRLRSLRTFLDDEGLYVALINGFPYGPFHGTAVKADAYAPDWRHDARVAYTLDLVRILGALLPEGLDGGVSTAPLSYKAWMKEADRATWQAITGNVVRVAEALARAHSETGALMHLDIEPEPDCSIETTDESILFFDEWLLPSGARDLSARLSTNEENARALLREHIRLCFDCCHFAVEYEDPGAALDRLKAAGIGIGRVQLSSALQVGFPSDPKEIERTAGALRSFADATYLHQVVQRGGSCGDLCRYPDLGDALSIADPGSSEWRIHFHVPLFAREYESFGSTQDYVRRVIALALRSGFTRHLEIETYTWDVLPDGLKLDLLESITREYEWVLGAVDEAASTAPSD